jgi:hypothetical protein
MFQISHNWNFDVDYGPEWLFFRLLNCPDEEDPGRPVAERIWEIAERRCIFRLVIETNDDVLLTSSLIGQLILLHKRSHQMGGVTRLCGISETNYQSIQIMRLGERFPNYRTRDDAVRGYAWNA